MTEPTDALWEIASRYASLVPAAADHQQIWVEPEGRALAIVGRHFAAGWCWCQPLVVEVPGPRYDEVIRHARFADRGRADQEAGVR